MTLTAPGYEDVSAMATRNAVTSAEHRAGETIASRNAREARAGRTGGVCAACDRGLSAGEPVWRIRVSRQVLAGWGSRIIPVCLACRPNPATDPWLAQFGPRFLPVQPCGGCGRPVHNLDDGKQYRRRHPACSERCKRTSYGRARRERRYAARQRICEGCGLRFSATRSDAKYHSNACRQRAYRDRSTLG